VPLAGQPEVHTALRQPSLMTPEAIGGVEDAEGRETSPLPPPAYVMSPESNIGDSRAQGPPDAIERSVTGQGGSRQTPVSEKHLHGVRGVGSHYCSRESLNQGGVGMAGLKRLLCIRRQVPSG